MKRKTKCKREQGNKGEKSEYEGSGGQGAGFFQSFFFLIFLNISLVFLGSCILILSCSVSVSVPVPVCKTLALYSFPSRIVSLVVV